MHGYFGWYETLVGGLTLSGVLAVGSLVLVAAFGHGRSLLRALLAAPEERGALQVARLAQAALVFLFLQETLEHSVSLGRAAVPAFAPSIWLPVLFSLVFFAALLVLAGRVVAGIVRLVLEASPRAASPTPVPLPRPRTAPRRRRPLADRRGLRAPPLLAG